MNTRHALVCCLVAALALCAFDRYRIAKLEDRVAFDLVELQRARHTIMAKENCTATGGLSLSQ